jgi:RNA polymerase sigma-70 factor (ECF subfamily)
MLGSVSETEDILQEAFLRHQHALAEGAEIESTRAYLSAVVTRLSIDYLRSARARREVYVGEWLPEPLITEPGLDDPARHAEQSDSLSFAFLVLLERLSPVERAVFLLHDVFSYSYSEIASIVGKSDQYCRQLAVRARRHLEAEKPQFESSRPERERLADRFFAAVTDGDVDALVEMLADDVVVYGDGGGKSPSWPRPITGRARVARLLAGVGVHLRNNGATVGRQEVNGQPGAVVVTEDGSIINIFVLDVADGVIQTVRSVINPDKLRHLGPVADVRRLLAERRGR